MATAELSQAAEERIRSTIRMIQDSKAREDVFPGRLSTPNWAKNTRVALPNKSSHIPDKPSTDMLRTMLMPEAAGDSRTALAIAVEDTLGYTPLRKHTNAPSRLQRVLAELEITAFDLKSVKEYKDRMQKHFQAKLDSEPQSRGMIDDRSIMFGFSGIGTRMSVNWQMVRLSDYPKPVPEFVLSKCMQIKQREPEAMFFVDELVQSRKTFDPFMWVGMREGNLEDALPFEVWDEPEFEKTL